jgi:hypothetical protein
MWESAAPSLSSGLHYREMTTDGGEIQMESAKQRVALLSLAEMLKAKMAG